MQKIFVFLWLTVLTQRGIVGQNCYLEKCNGDNSLVLPRMNEDMMMMHARHQRSLLKKIVYRKRMAYAAIGIMSSVALAYTLYNLIQPKQPRLISDHQTQHIPEEFFAYIKNFSEKNYNAQGESLKNIIIASIKRGIGYSFYSIGPILIGTLIAKVEGISLQRIKHFVFGDERLLYGRYVQDVFRSFYNVSEVVASLDEHYSFIKQEKTPSELSFYLINDLKLACQVFVKQLEVLGGFILARYTFNNKNSDLQNTHLYPVHQFTYIVNELMSALERLIKDVTDRTSVIEGNDCLAYTVKCVRCAADYLKHIISVIEDELYCE